MRRHLEAKRVEPDTIDAAVAELCEQGYLDDAGSPGASPRTAARWTRWGNERIERKLLRARRRAPSSSRRRSAARDGGGELEAALAVLRRRFRGVPETERDRDRALGLLVRKGYELEIAYDAIRPHAGAPGTRGRSRPLSRLGGPTIRAATMAPGRGTPRLA